MTAASIALLGVTAAAALALVVGWIRWSIRTAVKEVVNGKVDRVQRTVESIHSWTEKHDKTHAVEQGALLAALARQGVNPPDGWPHE